MSQAEAATAYNVMVELLIGKDSTLLNDKSLFKK